jgi:hypothetical protein
MRPKLQHGELSGSSTQTLHIYRTEDLIADDHIVDTVSDFFHDAGRVHSRNMREREIRTEITSAEQRVGGVTPTVLTAIRISPGPA